jgi:hypothetical protein
METSCREIRNCVKASGSSLQDGDLLAVYIRTGYMCPNVGSRLVAHMDCSPAVRLTFCDSTGQSEIFSLLGAKVAESIVDTILLPK